MGHGSISSVCMWTGFSADENKHNRKLRSMDMLGLLAFVLAYCVISWGVSRRIQDNPWKKSCLMCFARVLLALACTYLFTLAVLLPSPVEASASFQATAVFGRSIYLTQHCLALLTTHMSLSCVAPLSPKLLWHTHGVALCASALSAFVTVQYFSIVYDSRNKQFDLWEQRGVQLKEAAILLHAAPYPICIVDLLLMKDIKILDAATSLRSSCIFSIGYCFVYVAFIWLNFHFTHQWPYGFLEDLDQDCLKWSIATAFWSFCAGALTCTNYLLMVLRRALHHAKWHGRQMTTSAPTEV